MFLIAMVLEGCFLIETLALLPTGQRDLDGTGLAALCQYTDGEPIRRPAEAPGHRSGAGQ